MAVVNMVQSPFAVHNLHGPDKNVGRRHTSIEMFLNRAKGGIGGFNELNSKDRSFLKDEAAKRRLNVQIVGANGVVWDPSVHRVGKPRVRKIMQGGHVGADGVATPKKGDDDRRVGPSRYGLYFPVYTYAVALEWEFDVTHTMARAFTLHKWRIPLYRKSIRSLADGVLEPNGLMTGDFNTNPPVDLPGVNEVNVPVPPDMGKQHYTKVMRWGQHIHVGKVYEQNTPSDHDLLYAKLTFYRIAQDKLQAPAQPKPVKPAKAKPKLPQPGDGTVKWRKYGAPVAHPWMERPTKWKRRHKKLWIRIGKWQAAYLRRL